MKYLLVTFAMLSTLSALASTLPRAAEYKYNCQLSDNQGAVVQKNLVFNYNIASKRGDSEGFFIAKRGTQIYLQESRDKKGSLEFVICLGLVTAAGFEIRSMTTYNADDAKVGSVISDFMKTGIFGKKVTGVECKLEEMNRT